MDIAQLVSELPDDVVITDADRMDKYRRDRAHGSAAGVPRAVVRARSTEDVQVVMRFAAAHGTPVVPRGAGTGLSGGASAVDGCIVLSTERMTAVEVDPASRTAVVQPGLVNAQVKAAAAEHGLWYPPDPASYEICSIGGNVATNAGGLCCVKYGVTSDYVLGLTVVLADGTAVRLGGPRLKDAAGLSLTKLFVGSEGALGIITEVVLRLVPRRPPPATLVVGFADLRDATASILAITRQLRPAMLELMDRTTIQAVDDMMNLDLDRRTAAMLVIQSDEPGEQAARDCAVMAAVCEDNHATEVFLTEDAQEGEALVAARRNAVPAVERMGTVLLEDVGVALPQLGALVEGVAAISEANDVTIAVIAHAGDGNAHPMIVLDPSDEGAMQRAATAYDEVMRLAIALGGTITGEHGVGRLKRPWLGDYLGPDAHELNRRVKDALDPLGILNPGAVL